MISNMINLLNIWSSKDRFILIIRTLKLFIKQKTESFILTRTVWTSGVGIQLLHMLKVHERSTNPYKVWPNSFDCHVWYYR